MTEHQTKLLLSMLLLVVVGVSLGAIIGYYLRPAIDAYEGRHRRTDFDDVVDALTDETKRRMGREVERHATAQRVRTPDGAAEDRPYVARTHRARGMAGQRR